MNLAYNSVKKKTNELMSNRSKHVTNKVVSPYILRYRGNIATQLKTISPLGVSRDRSSGLGQAVTGNPIATRNIWGSLSTALSKVGDFAILQESNKLQTIQARIQALSKEPGLLGFSKYNTYLGVAGLSLATYLLLKRKR